MDELPDLEKLSVAEKDQLTLYDWQHYIPLIQCKPGALRNGAPFADMRNRYSVCRTLLLRREGFDHVMAHHSTSLGWTGLAGVTS